MFILIILVTWPLTTSNLSRAYATRDNIDPTTWGILFV